MNDKRKPLRDSMLPLALVAGLGLLVSLLNSRHTQLILTTAVVMAVLMALCMFFTARFSGKKAASAVGPQDQTEQALQKLFRRRKMMLWTCAALVTAGLLMAGFLSRLYLRRTVFAQVLFLVLCALPFLLMGFNQLLLHLESVRWNKASAQEVYAFLDAHRETDNSEAMFRRMVHFRHLAQVYTVILGLTAAALSFTAGLVCRKPTFFVPPFLLADLCFICAFSRIHLKIPKNIIQAGCVSEKDYPLLYEMARKAQKALGLTGDVRIDISSECNAGLAMEGDTSYLTLGATLMAIASQEELYAVMLHEFGHAAASTEAIRRESSYTLWLNTDASGRFIGFFLFACFGFFDVKYTVQRQLYEYAVSLKQEFAADHAMVEHGDPAAAGSVLLKLSYFDYYQWEESTEPNLFTEEAPSKTALRDRIAIFRQAIEDRKEDWNRLAANEIQSKSASHPTLRARLEAMGIRDIGLICGTRSEAYEAECDRALTYVDGYIYDDMLPDYEENRKYYYLEPLEAVRKWELLGRPLEADAYTDMVLNLQSLHRYRQAEALCDRAIAELPIAASHDACYIKGSMLLHRYDPEGIDYLYRAIEANSNHIQAGMDEIGTFCCLTGRQEELDAYRKRAVELSQKDHDAYRHLSTLERTDRLSTEHLPEELHRQLVEFLTDLDDGSIDRAYLVHKQITDDFFASALVIRYRKDADPKTVEDLDHRIFRFLDTATDWQFTLFDYDEVRSVHVENIPHSCIYVGQPKK